MAFWDGKRWTDEREPQPKQTSRTRLALIHSSQALLEAGMIAVLLGGLAFGTAFAKGGGNGGGSACHKNCGGGSSLAVKVNPNPVPAYSEFQLTGCGFAANAGLQYNLYTSGGTAVYGGMADASGCLYNAWLWATAPSSAKVVVLLNSTTVVASTTFTIQ